jgi:PAS domain S-box-containing protein
MQEPSISSAPIHVLLVEGNRADALTVRALLELVQDRRYETTQVSQVSEALDAAASRAFDVILLGVGSAEGDAVAGLSTLRHRLSTIPVVTLLTVAGDDVVLDAVRGGTLEHLIKGELTASRLARAIESALARHRAEETLRTSQQRLQESEDRLRLAIDSTELGAFDYYPQTGELLWSVYAKRHFGLPPYANVDYERFLEGLHPDDRDRVHATVQGVLRGEADGRYATEYRTIGIEDGKERWLAAWGRAFFDGDQPTRFIGVTLDITDRKRTEQALLDADKRKTEFLATLAHELRNPLAPVRFAVKVLQDHTPPSPATDRALMIIGRQVAQLARLIDDLLDVSRITSNKVQLRLEPVWLADVVRGAVEATAPLIEAAGQTLRLVLPDEPIALQADATRLVQVFSNLLNNASKFTPSGGAISITATREGSAAVIHVSDTGIGIAPDALPFVFDMFRQEDVSLERSAGGLGIGLTLAKTLVEMHGGSIDARSPGIGGGADFTVTLNTVPLPVRSEEHASRDRTLPPDAGMRVLIVDDHADAAEMLEVCASSQGHTTAVAHDGGSALSAAETFRPHVILLDIGLPGLNGYDVAREVRARPALHNVFLVAVTGWGHDDDRRKARDAGFDFHLTKPVDPSALESLLQDLAIAIHNTGEPAGPRPRTRAADPLRR